MEYPHASTDRHPRTRRGRVAQHDFELVGRPRAETPSARGSDSLHHAVLHAVRSAAKLGSSLIATWAVGLAVRVYLPRHLGPSTFGGLQFADAFTAAVFILANLGLDTYVRKEMTTHREHASEFFGGTLVLRLALSAVALLIAVIALHAAGRTRETLYLVAVLAVVQILATCNGTFAAMLQAVGEVDGLAVWSVASKICWGVGIVIALSLGWGVLGVVAAVVAAEALKTARLAMLARRHVGLRFRVDAAATLAVVRASLPYFTASVAQTVYCRVDVSIMAFLASDTEVGWYGAAGTLAGLSLLLSPLIGWVLLPLTSRAATLGADELMLVARRSMELILTVAVPASLFLFVGAEPIVAIAFGRAYAPAAMSLRLLAPTFVLTYSAMVSASVLVRLDRGWAVTWVTMSGMLLSPALNVWLIPRGLRTIGPGGAGVGAGTALVLTELYTAGTMAWLIGRRGLDLRLTRMLARTGAVCAAVLAADHVLTPLGTWRLGADALLYVVGVFASGALSFREVHRIARGLASSRLRSPARAVA